MVQKKEEKKVKKREVKQVDKAKAKTAKQTKSAPKSKYLGQFSPILSFFVKWSIFENVRL